VSFHQLPYSILVKKRVLLCYKVAGQNAKKTHAISCHPTAHFTPPIQLFQHPTIPGGRFNVASHFTRDMFSHPRGAEITNMTVRWQ